jgi:hypothetical protein
MAHVLVIASPDDQHDPVLQAAHALGHRCTLASVDPARHRHPARALPRDPQLWPGAIAAMHRQDAFEALLCLDPAHQVDSAEIARALGLRHAAPEAVALCHDLPALRLRLAVTGIAQPSFERVDPDEALARVVDAVIRVGLPAIIRPGAGQPAVVLRDARALALWRGLMRMVARNPRDYGAGIAKGPLIVERFIAGPLVRCVVLRSERGHRVLDMDGTVPIDWLDTLLDAIGLDGAVQVDCKITEAGPKPIAVHAFPDFDMMGSAAWAEVIEWSITPPATD